MKRDQFLFLLGGLAFGILIGFGSYHAIHETPQLDGQASMAAPPAPRGPAAPTQTGGPNADGGAPMVARVNELKRMLQENPDDPQVLLALANIYYDAAMWEQAAGYYERVAAIEPTPDLLTDLGVCYRGLQRFDEALDRFARAQSMDSGHWQSLFNTVVVAGFDKGDLETAREALASMEAMNPRPAELPPERLRQLRELLDRAAAAEPEAS